ncbi:Vacuolar protein sorting-associated protein 11 [Coemansia sp. RSA 989]|nr:Vacuolar protein sorting-associated protein 11 [Coemansia sp. RSA 1086]KAJ1749232.1 Vacuolar protein sorting-associated protein 11 [Coemansia sp. RSA 1821]KAJ1862137.1 Vacuolar protein sorting-associated protein 11 [Coemansia sp. RSA 989]KAJ1871166.1 Vacuolar protein sorting-associated protein 11 [Coemansia sp. RSA 990]KAJ2646760.1 Vacuolar protein sorting-associated protein 11 [Coemansia sp. RSA 1250]KAJ2677208.1 Vacuolar protein sorting-associated protein 11 [Coemansia sp. RSA 1085]
MTSFQLRQFHFFKREALEELPAAFKQPELLMASNGGDLVFLADSGGYVHVLNRSFVVRSFMAASDAPGMRITQMLHIHQTRTLLTVEENVSAATSRPAIKLWSVDRLLRQSDVQPVTVKYQQPTTTPYPLTAVSATPSISQIALGFAGGHIVLIRGNILKSRSTKQRTLHVTPEPITNLHFVTNSTNVTLFATTTAQTMVFDTTNNKSDPVTLEERGCGIGCSLINEDDELIVARDEAIYTYTADGRGPCFAFDAPKVLLRRFKHYLLLATAAPSSMAPNMAPDDERVVDEQVYSFNDATTFTILDTKNKLVAYTGVVSGGVRGVATEWGSIFVLGGHGTLDFYSEKDLLERLDILYRQNLYPLAVKMAQNGNYDMASVAGIYKRYGDWLYSKDDFDTAMSQYMQTIGFVEPSYVIRKYLDAQRLGNLTSYLQELHTAGMATSDHTTLLLNCYTKLRDEERLNQFIHTQEDYQFDVDTAIHVCRQAGFYEQALYLADKFSKTGMYLKLKIEDQDDIQAALEYMRKLGDMDISAYMAEFGRRCLSSLPRETTELLIDVCIKGMDARAVVAAERSSTNGVTPIGGQLLSMRRIQHLFADQPDWLAAFLEQVIARRWQQRDSDLIEEEDADMKSAWNTLLELYLCGVESPLQDPGSSSASKQTPTERALDLLRNPHANMDWERAYILCASNGFIEGIAALYEQRGDVAALLDLFIEHDDLPGMRKLLDKHGGDQPDLYIKALHYLARNPQLADNEELLSDCLSTIEKHNLMSPLRVLQALGGSEQSGVTLGMVRGYIMRQINATTTRIQENKAAIDTYASKYAAHSEKMDTLKSKPVVFQSTKCTSCMAPLDLPSVHFLCKHSYHQRCLGDVGDSCPRCQAQNQKLEDQRRVQETSAKQHDAFFEKLQHADDGFDVIASWFAKSPFSFTKLVDQ